jgi:hypothetical protein
VLTSAPSKDLSATGGFRGLPCAQSFGILPWLTRRDAGPGFEMCDALRPPNHLLQAAGVCVVLGKVCYQSCSRALIDLAAQPVRLDEVEGRGVGVRQ